MLEDLICQSSCCDDMLPAENVGRLTRGPISTLASACQRLCIIIPSDRSDLERLPHVRTRSELPRKLLDTVIAA